MSAPSAARLDDNGNRIYTWTGRGSVEEFYSVTTIIGQGIPKYLVPWAAKCVAELAYLDVEKHGKRALARWGKEGKAYVAAQRAAGMKLAKIDESPRALGLRYLKGEPDRIRDSAAEVGTAVHAEAEDLVLANAIEAERLYIAGEKLPTYDPAIAPRMAGFVAWLNTTRPYFLATEATVYNRAQVYAGTGDAFAVLPIEGRDTTLYIDYKSGNRIYPEVAVQSGAYAHGEFIGGADGVSELPVPTVDGTAVLHITPKGSTLRGLRYDEQVFRTFLYAREIFRWGIELSKTAIGDRILPDLEDALVASIEGVA